MNGILIGAVASLLTEAAKRIPGIPLSADHIKAIRAIGVLVAVGYAVALALFEPGGLAALDFGKLLPLVVEAVTVLVGYAATYQAVLKPAKT